MEVLPMEKISRILPPSNRVTTVDTESSPSLRPGAPSMGRRSTEGKRNEVAASGASNRDDDRMTLSQSALDRLKAAYNGDDEENLVGNIPKKNSESAKLKIVEDLNRKFFANLRKEIMGRDSSKSEQLLEESDLSPMNGSR